MRDALPLSFAPSFAPRFAVSFAALLLAPATAYACSSSVDHGLSTFPGYGAFGQHVGMVLPVLAGVLERPLLSWAGVSRGALALSLQGSILAAFVAGIGGAGVYTFAFSLGALASVALFGWMFGSIVLAAFIKWAWVRYRTGGDVSLGKLVAASGFSATVIGFLPMYQYALGARHWVTQRWIISNAEWWLPATIFTCLALYVVAFTFRGQARPRRTSHGAHGFQVVAPEPPLLPAVFPSGRDPHPAPVPPGKSRPVTG